VMDFQHHCHPIRTIDLILTARSAKQRTDAGGELPVRLQEADCLAPMLIVLVFRQSRRTPVHKTDLPTEASSLGRIVGNSETGSISTTINFRSTDSALHGQVKGRVVPKRWATTRG